MLNKNKKRTTCHPDPGFALGRHVTIEYYDCASAVLLDKNGVESILLRAARESGATIVSSAFHQFEPQGVSGVVIIAESHFTVHVWPEHNYAAVDIFTCADNVDLDTAIHSMKVQFSSQRVFISSDQNRGLLQLMSGGAPCSLCASLFCRKNTKRQKCMRTEKLDGLEIKLVRAVPVDQLGALYKDAGWWQNTYKISDEFLRRIPEQSALFAGAFLEKKIIGMGRALSDLCSDAYIQDIVVLSAYRKFGIGTLIVTFLIQELKKRGVDWIGLIGEPGTRPFYEKLGFRQMKDHVPFKLE